MGRPIFRTRFLFILFCLVIASLAGCNHHPKGDIKRRFDIASSYFGDQFELYYIPSYGWIADREFIKLTSPEDPSADAKHLATRMREGENKLTKLVVSSPAAAKMATILSNATYINREQQLPHLELLYIGETEFESPLRRDIEALGAKFYFQAD